MSAPAVSAPAVSAPAVSEAAPRRTLPNLSRLRQPLLALALPVAMGIAWHLLTVGKPYSLIPPPAEVWTAMVDLAIGGPEGDAFSGTLLTHLVASLTRVFGGFGLAALAAVPLGLLIGRVPIMSCSRTPTMASVRSAQNR